MVAGIYRNLFELVVPTITTLDFSGLGWAVQEALILARAIPEMGSLTEVCSCAGMPTTLRFSHLPFAVCR